jgi:acetaldehyde dehydrogenase/alcohol dehydrogenase
MTNAPKEKVALVLNDTVQSQIEALVAGAKEAQRAFEQFTQEQVDAVVKAMTLAGIEQHFALARMAVEETGMGVYEDKVTKNLFATEYIYHDIKNIKTVGIITDAEADGYMEVADPVGIIAGVTPVTNPTATTMFKCLIALKTRNPIIFAFHPKAQRCSAEAARIMRDAAIKAGAPAGCISWIETPSIEATNALMKHPDVALILATGGSGMVAAAYSSGKPAIGVGPGNVPAYIEQSADIDRAVNDIILSKTFDNGMICASEQAVVVDEAIADRVLAAFAANGAYILSDEETKKLGAIAVDPKRCAMAPAIVGQPATKIAAMAGIKVPASTRLLIAKLSEVGPQEPLSREKLSPILGFYVVKNHEEGIRRCEQLTEFGGLGHSAVIHSNNEAVIREFARRVRTGRLLVNSPSTHGAIGDLYNTNTPSLTLGCGTMGGNATTANVSVRQLLNIKRVAKRQPRMKWFRLPERIYFEPGSIAYLAKLHATRAFIVTDEMMVKLGIVEKAVHHLEKRGIAWEIFSEVEPDPSVDTVKKGVAAMNRFQPDAIIALGGGSPIDAAKGMWLFYEQPDLTFDSLRLKFMDIRKRAFKFPELGRKAKFVAIPTTSGTGSEVTCFTVITDKVKNIKYPLADYELTPDVAIIDPELVVTCPPKVTADTGMDVLTHAIEAYVSVMASDYTDALALKAIELVFKYLPAAYKNGSDRVAREKMHNASTMAGMAFTNAFLGINHSLAHILGATFHIAHGRANAILMPHVIRYNASAPTKRVAFPQYESYVAPQRYQEIAKHLGLPASTPAEGVESLCKAIQELMIQLDMPLTLKEWGIQKEVFAKEVDRMAEIAFADQCTGSNPRLPLVPELAQIYWNAFGEAPEAPVKKEK